MSWGEFRGKAAQASDFGEVLQPGEAMEPILARPIRDALIEWLTEVWSDAELAAVGLKPRRKALFDGPPGVGKTTLAHHLAARLGLPMLVVRPERLIDKWVGSSARNIGDLFDCVTDPEAPLLLFFDEFDAVGQKRKAAETGADEELNNYVNTLLQRIEQHDGFLIAATNRGSEIDPAIWRRFEVHLTVELPGPFERERILARYLAPYQVRKADLERLAAAFETASPALMRAWCEGLKRRLVIGPKVGWDMSRDALVGALLATIQPHPDLGKPRLWSLGLRDDAIRHLPWPLTMDKPPDESVTAVASGAENVISFGGRP